MRTNQHLHEGLQSSYVDLERISAAFATLERFSAVSAVAESALIDCGIQSVNAEPVAQFNMRLTPQHLTELKKSFIECNKVLGIYPPNAPK